MQHDIPCCLLCKAWRQLEAFLHLVSVISVSGDSHLVQSGEQEGATQTVPENGFFTIHLLLAKKTQLEVAFDKQLEFGCAEI